MSVHTGISEYGEEARVARGTEISVPRIPAAAYMWLGSASILASALLKVTEQDTWALFVGQWAPTFFVLGAYNKFQETAAKRQREVMSQH